MNIHTAITKEQLWCLPPADDKVSGLLSSCWLFPTSSWWSQPLQPCLGTPAIWNDCRGKQIVLNVNCIRNRKAKRMRNNIPRYYEVFCKKKKNPNFLDIIISIEALNSIRSINKSWASIVAWVEWARTWRHSFSCCCLNETECTFTWFFGKLKEGHIKWRRRRRRRSKKALTWHSLVLSKRWTLRPAVGVTSQSIATASGTHSMLSREADSRPMRRRQRCSCWPRMCAS